jgi:hypothetical protein
VKGPKTIAAVFLMNGAKSQAAIAKEAQIDSGQLSRLVKALAKESELESKTRIYCLSARNRDSGMWGLYAGLNGVCHNPDAGPGNRRHGQKIGGREAGTDSRLPRRPKGSRRPPWIE